jgi:hypothetical protein
MMHLRPHLWLTLMLLLTASLAGAQHRIQGSVTETDNKRPIYGVAIINIHTGQGVHTDSAGRFAIDVTAGQLLELRKIGYRVLRLRIPQGSLPPYFRLQMETGAYELPEYLASAPGMDYKRDSIESYERYRTALNTPKLEGLDVIRHTFSAMSKRNRMIWAFQEEFKFFEQQKYIDYTFNERLIARITGLTGDSARAYMIMYRPKYEDLRNMPEYDFYTYIQRTVDFYRRGYNPRRPPNRSAQ